MPFFSYKRVGWLFMLIASLLAVGLIGSGLSESRKKRPIFLIEFQTTNHSFMTLEKKETSPDLFATSRFREELANSYQSFEPPTILKASLSLRMEKAKNRSSLAFQEKKPNELVDFSKEISDFKAADFPLMLRGPSSWSCLDFLKQE